MRILGIDPGTATTGFGLIEVNGKSLMVKEWGLIETDKGALPGDRLVNINEQFTKLLKDLSPDIISIEKLFFATNAKTAMSVGQAIGIIIYTAAKAGIKIVEYAPGTVKKQITGSGRADKKMIQKAVRKILGAKVRSRIHGKTHFDNSADALAVALCHWGLSRGVNRRGR
jgi:crossover junction endodeoxyribonuclease RuvC